MKRRKFSNLSLPYGMELNFSHSHMFTQRMPLVPPSIYYIQLIKVNKRKPPI